MYIIERERERQREREREREKEHLKLMKYACGKQTTKGGQLMLKLENGLFITPDKIGCYF